MSRTRSILEELTKLHREKDRVRDRDHFIESRAQHVIESAINLIAEIEDHYEAEDAKDLSNRLINSIRGRDQTKFARGIRRVIKERRGENN
jgi:hypothetical protein